MKAALIITGMLAVDAAALLWVQSGFQSSRVAWQKVRKVLVNGDGGFRHHL